MGGREPLPEPGARPWLHPSEVPPPVVAARRGRWVVPAAAGAMVLAGALLVLDATATTRRPVARPATVADQVLGVVAWTGPQARYGSAVVARPGVLLTSSDLVDHASGLEVVLPDGRRVRARVVGTDGARGLAVMETDGEWLAPTVTSSTALARRGEVLRLVAAGGSSTGARVAAVGRVVRHGDAWRVDMIEVSGRVPDGAEGAAVVGPSGGVVGMLAHRRAGHGNGALVVPMPALDRVVSDILRHGRPRHPWVGLAARATGPGVVEVVGTASDGPARAGGVRPGDRVLAVGGAPVGTVADLVLAVHRLDVGDTATVVVERDGRRRSVRVEVAERATIDGDE